MTPDEAVSLCRYVKACCPQQAIDQWTPAAWADHLEAVPFVDAKAAVKSITAKQAFVTIAEVLVVVRQIRAKRIADHPPLIPPSGLTEAEERAWIGEARRRVGDGQQVEGRGQLVQRHMPELKALVARGPVMPVIEPLLRPEDHSREPEPQEAS